MSQSTTKNTLQQLLHINGTAVVLNYFNSNADISPWKAYKSI